MDLPLLVPSALAFLVAACLALGLTPPVRALALRVGAIDHALGTRKRHGAPVPRLGGLAIALGAGASLAVAYLAYPPLRQDLATDRALALMVGTLAILALGVVDDLRGLRASPKLAVQVAAAALAFWAGFRIETLPVPFGEPLALGLASAPLTVLWMVGVTNALNLADGLDGLAAGQAVLALGAYLVMALAGGDGLVALVTAAAAGSALGFLRHNRHPATIFMGDAGSLLLGFLLAVSSVALLGRNPGGTAAIAPAVAVALPVADAALAFLRRLLRGFPVARGDRGHLHHRVLDRLGSHRETVRVLWCAALAVALGSLGVAFAPSVSGALMLAALAVAGLVTLRILGYMPFERRRELLEERRRNLELRAGVREAAERLRTAAGPEEVWDVVREVGLELLGARSVRLWLPSGLGTALFATPGDPARFLSRFGLLGDRPGAATLELGWDDGRTALDRDTEVAVELLCDRVAAAIGRVEPARGRRSAPGQVRAPRRSGTAEVVGEREGAT
jgi:UDP-GlcNAc:undecaprenyl-phosphate GlcNAc-1-phosphate transferase